MIGHSMAAVSNFFGSAQVGHTRQLLTNCNFFQKIVMESPLVARQHLAS